VEFTFAAKNFILFIYKSGWNKLTVNKDNKSFRKCALVQFKLRRPMNNTGNNKKLAKSGKKAKVFRVPPSISPKLSKKVLEKSKFYKDNGKNTDI